MARTDFRLTKDERKRLREAIERFEKETSAELKVVLAHRVEGDAMEYAKREFLRLGLTNTALRNAVLIAVVLNQRRVVVLGDEGIHRALPPGTWEQVVERIVSEFREGRYYHGLAGAIEELGALFARYFPYRTDDVNEIPDEILDLEGESSSEQTQKTGETEERSSEP
ncbi:MAG: hypothetical protein KatS3mg115_2512 [Candidatus Poribacteria bacterium]|nr:MAG: hypothetical protein KatS3mg115_2512 [Candidatus Poribacteria bacterium]